MNESGAANTLFESSYRRLFGRAVAAEGSEPFFSAFYRRFLADDGVAELFRATDMAKQVNMLRKSFFHLVAFQVTGAPSSELERMARMHHLLGIDPSLYDVWLNGIVATVREFDPECDETTALAWRLALTPGITYMKLYEHFAARLAV